MTTYIANMAIAYNGTHTNDGTTNGWGGATGIVRAASEVTAGDAIHIRNAATVQDNVNLAFLMRIPVVSTANIAVGDLLTDTTASPNATLRVAVVVTDDYVLGEYQITPGGTFANGHTVTTDGGTTSTTIDDDPNYPGILLSSDFAVDGATTAPVVVRGYASDGTTPQAAYLDSISTAAGLVIDGVDHWHIHNVQLEDAANYGVQVLAPTVYGWRLEGVTVNDAGSHGFRDMHNMQYSHVVECATTDNGGDGFNSTPLYGSVVRCAATGNTGRGINYVQTLTRLVNCLSADNGSNGIFSAGNGVSILGCVIDDNGGAGIALATGVDGAYIGHNRITNNGGYGIDVADIRYDQFSDYNLFFGNASGPLNNLPGGANDHGPTGSGLAYEDVTADGYTDAGSGDYTLTAAAVLRREAVTVDASNSVHIAAGFAGDDLAIPHDHQVSFHDHEVTFP